MTFDQISGTMAKHLRLMMELNKTGVNMDWLTSKNPTTKQLEDLLRGIEYLQEKVTYP